MDIKILIAAHKKAELPTTEIYLPVQVGAKLNNTNIGYQRDDEGDNISELNPYFCELTALYWAWKNLDVEYLGLTHYRRFFAKKKVKYSKNVDLNSILVDKSFLERKLANGVVLVPRKRNYYIMNLYEHYARTFSGEHLDITREIIKATCPDYLDSFDSVLNQKTAYAFNMYIAPKKLSDDYCEWLFPILKELHTKIDYSNMTPFEARLVGRVSERLFNVWLEKNNVVVEELELFDNFNVNWWKKGSAFLMAKFFNKKYRESF